MSTTKSKRRSRKSTRTAASSDKTVDIITQLKTAIANPLAAVLGAAIGGIVPWFAREIAHHELAVQWASGDLKMVAVDLAIVLGCAVFSMLTVYGFGKAAISDPRKAAGFCAALEGVMLVSHGQTSQVALAALVIINAITTGCVIAVAYAATNRRREADQRRAQTRAQTAARKRGAAGVPAAAAGAPSSRSAAEQAAAAPSSAAPTHAAPRAHRAPVVVAAAPRTTPGHALVVQARRGHHDVSDAEIVREWSFS